MAELETMWECCGLKWYAINSLHFSQFGTLLSCDLAGYTLVIALRHDYCVRACGPEPCGTKMAEQV